MSDFKRWMLVLGAVLLGWLVYALSPILMPFLAGALLAYLGNPLVVRLGRLGLGRTWAAALAFLVLVLVIMLGLALALPALWQQLIFLESKLPGLLRWVNSTGIPWFEHHFHVHIGRLDMTLLSAWIADYSQELGTLVKDLLPQVARSGFDVLAYTGLLALVPVVTFYLLLDWSRLIVSIRNLVPRQYEPLVSRLARESDVVLASFVRGQLLVMLALGVVYSVGLGIVGLHVALVIGMVAGLASIIPYLGFAVGIVAATIAGLFQFGVSVETVAKIWGVFLVGQAIEGWILQPYLLGDRIGLHPVAVIFAVMAGGTLFGFFGMLLALPVAAVIMVLLRHLHGRYVDSDFYQRLPAEADDLDAP